MNLLPRDPIRRGKVTLLLVAAAFALPVVAGALAVVFGWSPGATGSYGDLLHPRSVGAVTLTEAGGNVLKFSDLRGRWALLMFDAPACSQACERKLYALRQARRALGADMARIERVWVLTEDGRPAARLITAIEGTRIVRVPDELTASVRASGGSLDQIYLVDPYGNLMMRFPGDPDPGGIIRDLRRLLKYVGRRRARRAARKPEVAMIECGPFRRSRPGPSAVCAHSA